MSAGERGTGRLSLGFTLLELMIVVAVIGILAAIAVPKFANMIRKSREGASKGNLGAIRSALNIYYGDTEGQYPTDLTSLTINNKYLSAIPTAKTPDYHLDSNVVSQNSGASSITDAGGWAYGNAMGDSNFGTLWINCTHTDAAGHDWTNF